MGNKQSGDGGGGGGESTARRASTTTAPQRSPLDAIASTRDAQSTLDKKIEHMQKQITAERDCAKRALQEKTNQQANKKRAQRHLLKARQLQNQIDKYMGMRDNLESVQVNLEMGAVTKNIHGAMRTANTAMKDLSKELDVDKMDDLMADITDGMQSMEEATTLMSQPINSDPLADEEAENDLAELMDEIADEEEEEEAAPAPVVKAKKPAAKLPPQAPGAVSLPTAPQTKPTKKKTAEEEEREELEAFAKSMS